MSLSGKMNLLLVVGSLPCSPRGRQSGRMPDPVIGPAPRHGRLTASPGGALTGRDRSLQCEKVSKATSVTVRSRTQEVVGEVGANGFIRVISFLRQSPKRGPL